MISRGAPRTDRVRRRLITRRWRAPQSPLSSLPCARLVATCRAAAPLRVNVVCFDLHRQVSMLAPAMAWCPALLTAAPRRRRGCLTAGAPGSLLAAAPPRPPFPQPLAQFLQLRSRRLQFAFQPLLSLYRLAMHSAVIARLPALLYYLAPQLRQLSPACRRAAFTSQNPPTPHFLAHRSGCVPSSHTANIYAPEAVYASVREPTPSVARPCTRRSTRN